MDHKIIENTSELSRPEDFFRSSVSSKKHMLVIIGFGPSAIWIIEACLEHNIPFKLYKCYTSERLQELNFPINRAIIKRLEDEIEDYKKNSVVDQGFDVLTGKTILKEDEEGPSKELQKGFKDFLSKNAIVHSGKFGVIINNKREPVKFVELVMCIGYSPIEYKLNTQSTNLKYKSIARSKTKGDDADISPLSLSGSLYHSLYRRYIEILKELKLKDDITLANGGLKHLFFIEEHKLDFIAALERNNIAVKEGFIEKWAEKVKRLPNSYSKGVLQILREVYSELGHSEEEIE